MIKVYGKANCGKCQALKTKLSADGIEFEYIEDMKTLMIVASKARIMSAPVIEKEGTFYSMEKFLEVL